MSTTQFASFLFPAEINCSAGRFGGASGGRDLGFRPASVVPEFPAATRRNSPKIGCVLVEFGPSQEGNENGDGLGAFEIRRGGRLRVGLEFIEK
jgi:hypothetical protein